MIDEVLTMIEEGRVDPAEVNLGALIVEVKEAVDLREWSEKFSRLVRLARLKVRALVEKVLQLREGKAFTFVSPSLPLIPWISFREAEVDLKSLVEAFSRRRRVEDEYEEALLEKKDVVELCLVEERRHREDVLRRVAELGRVKVEELLEGGMLERVSIFVEVLRLITEGVLGYDRDTGEVYV
ncbi:MAG: hypothetical protein QXW47_03310 [Candidatus Jordarchaeales archaeon]|nr:hypothetical protein [Candidatus Jordarchaeia archaeon]